MFPALVFPHLPELLSNKSVLGITDITISAASQRSQPPPGEELLQMVEAAKLRGEIPKIHDSSVIRYVDGKWMAPQMCNK